MKTKNVKMMMMPAFAIVFAIVSAFATDEKGNEKQAAIVPGYIDAPSPCTLEVQCSTIEGPICTNEDGQQAFGKLNPNSTTCPIVLYRPMQ